RALCPLPRKPGPQCPRPSPNSEWCAAHFRGVFLQTPGPSAVPATPQWRGPRAPVARLLPASYTALPPSALARCWPGLHPPHTEFCAYSDEHDLEPRQCGRSSTLERGHRVTPWRLPIPTITGGRG